MALFSKHKSHSKDNRLNLQDVFRARHDGNDDVKLLKARRIFAFVAGSRSELENKINLC